jgi:hypothetical protein
MPGEQPKTNGKYFEHVLSTIQSIFEDITPIVSTRQIPPKSCHRIASVLFIDFAKQQLLMAKNFSA